MTAIFYPDISAYQAGIRINGEEAVCIKATEGIGWLSPDYEPALLRAANNGVWPFAYHFLHAGNPEGQAEWCYAHVCDIPLMLDWEPSGSSRPGISDAAGFTDYYRSLGGTVIPLYLPHWYWQQLGSPSLALFASRGMALVSSNYTGYSDYGPGWAPYGGMIPQIWQYTSAQTWNGQPVDYNAFQGTATELIELVSGRAVPPPPAVPAFPYPAGHYLGQPSQSPFCHSGYYGGLDQVNVHTWQAQMAKRGWIITQDGRFGPGSEIIARQFQTEKGLAVDGKVGRDTWGATWKAPVT
jgi:Glycosyl hydrolases family 25/Putative peptidoglycan binding domain